MLATHALMHRYSRERLQALRDNTSQIERAIAACGAFAARDLGLCHSHWFTVFGNQTGYDSLSERWLVRKQLKTRQRSKAH
jgi:hypothetical protein